MNGRSSRKRLPGRTPITGSFRRGSCLFRNRFAAIVPSPRTQRARRGHGRARPAAHALSRRVRQAPAPPRACPGSPCVAAIRFQNHPRVARHRCRATSVVRHLDVSAKRHSMSVRHATRCQERVPAAAPGLIRNGRFWTACGRSRVVSGVSAMRSRCRRRTPRRGCAGRGSRSRSAPAKKVFGPTS